MALDWTISNQPAGYIWLATGFVGTWWINRRSQQIRKDVGGWRRYFLGPEPSDEDRAKVVGLQIRLWSFFAAYLALFKLLDWLF